MLTIIRDRSRIVKQNHYKIRRKIAIDITRPLTYTAPMKHQRKDPAAVALGRKGGLKGGPARAAKMTAEERSESARKAVLARWAKAKKKRA